MVPEGKFVIVHAQQEARRRQADYIGTEHLLLGIVAEPAATGARALSECGATPEIIAAAVNGRIGLPSGKPRTDKLPFTRSAKSVLEHALRESLRLGHDYIGTEHLALACLTVPQGIVPELLRNLGVSYENLRAVVRNLTG
jgi:ATP-dependent Clp protease ATP-binding subunit ClpA